MVPSSLAVILVGLALGIGALAGFAWGWRRGQFTALGAQARVIFDERDLRIERPWESAVQRAERSAEHGAPLPPEAGEWGGAA